MSSNGIAVTVIFAIGLAVAVIARLAFGPLLPRKFLSDKRAQGAAGQRAELFAGVRVLSLRVLAVQLMTLPPVILVVLAGAPLSILVIFACAIGVTLAGLAFVKIMEWREGRAPA